jgi:hypothetical protein
LGQRKKFHEDFLERKFSYEIECKVACRRKHSYGSQSYKANKLYGKIPLQIESSKASILAENPAVITNMIEHWLSTWSVLYR